MSHSNLMENDFQCPTRNTFLKAYELRCYFPCCFQRQMLYHTFFLQIIYKQQSELLVKQAGLDCGPSHLLTSDSKPNCFTVCTIYKHPLKRIHNMSSRNDTGKLASILCKKEKLSFFELHVGSYISLEMSFSFVYLWSALVLSTVNSQQHRIDLRGTKKHLFNPIKELTAIGGAGEEGLGRKNRNSYKNLVISKSELGVLVGFLSLLTTKCRVKEYVQLTLSSYFVWSERTIRYGWFLKTTQNSEISNATTDSHHCQQEASQVLTPAPGNTQMLNTLSFILKLTAGNSLYTIHWMVSV